MSPILKNKQTNNQPLSGLLSKNIFVANCKVTVKAMQNDAVLLEPKAMHGHVHKFKQGA